MFRSSREVVGVLYAVNSFEFTTMEAFCRFLLLSPTSGLRRVSRIRLDWGGFRYWPRYKDPVLGRPLEYEESWTDICDVLVAMSNLRELTISGWDVTVSNPGRGFDPLHLGYDPIYEIVSPLRGLSERVCFRLLVDTLEDFQGDNLQDRLRRRGYTHVQLVHVNERK